MLLEVTNNLQVEGPFSPAEISQSEWTALWRRCSRSTIFQSPAWVHAWWAHFGGAHPWLVTFRDDARRLVGVAPLFLWPEERRVLLMGTGITDSLDILADEQWADPVANATLQWLDDCRNDWDVFDCQQLPPTSPLRTAALVPHWEESVRIQDTTPVLTLPPELQDMPRFDELDYLKRRLTKEGKVEIVAADEESFPDVLSAVVKLHSARWAERSESGVLADERIRDFHQAAAEGLLRLGVLRMYALKVNGNAVAAYYGFQHAGRAVYYLGGFDPEWKRFSAGTLIVGHAIEEAIREGAREFDFGRGREPYKYRWGAEDRFTYQRELHA